jgi:hypothetical protein
VLVIRWADEHGVIAKMDSRLHGLSEDQVNSPVARASWRGMRAMLRHYDACASHSSIKHSFFCEIDRKAAL